MSQDVAVVQVETPIELIKAGEALEALGVDTWYRGQGDVRWRLQSTLERDAELFGLRRELLEEREKTMLDLFKQRAHLYTGFHAPNTTFDWNALIRHHGGPSRLLDVTSSYLVATYFALSDSREGTDAVIWAFLRLHQPDGPVKDPWPECTPGEQVIVSKPDRLNERLNAQSGGFLIPCCVRTPLEQQVSKTLDTDLNSSKQYSVSQLHGATDRRIWKLVIPHRAHNELFRFVSRCNVRAYSLFPSMEGLAWSLREMMRIWD